MKMAQKYRQPVIYGLMLAALLFFLKWMEYRLIVLRHSAEIYMGITALLFTGLGIWLALRLARPKVVVEEKLVYVEKPPFFERNHAVLEETGLSERELEVLEGMAEGLSNQEIASRLYISVHTVKTHSARLFFKLDVARRTQAVEKARKFGIIP